MNKTKKVAIAAVMVAALSIFTLGAQMSATFAATQGRFSTDIDNFMSVGDFNTVDFGKFFSYVSTDGLTVSANKVDLGFATRFAGLYLGVYFGGSFMTGTNSVGTADQTVYNPTTGNPTGNSTATETVSGILTDGGNTYAVLVGVGDLGFKLSVNADTDRRTTRTQSTFSARFTSAPGAFPTTSMTTNAAGQKTGTTVDSYVDETYDITPQFDFGGLSFDLGGMSLGLKAGLGVRIYGVNKAYEYETKAAGVTTAKVSVTDTWGSYIAPTISLGAALNDLVKTDTSSLGVGLDYAIIFSIPTEKFEASNQIPAAKITWEQTREWTDMTNTIKPSVSYTLNFDDKVKIGTSFEAGMSIRSQTNGRTEYVTKSSAGGSVTAYDSTGTASTDREITTFTLAPKATVGLQYKATERLTINGGINVDIPSWTSTTTKTTLPKLVSKSTAASGTVTNTYTNEVTTEIVANEFTASGADFSVGFNFAFVPNVVLDVKTGVVNGSRAYDDILNFAQVALSIKL